MYTCVHIFVIQNYSKISQMRDNNNNIEVLNQKYYKLPHGITRTVAAKCGVSMQYVSAVKRGIRRNYKVLNCLLDELEKYEEEKKQLESRIKNL